MTVILVAGSTAVAVLFGGWIVAQLRASALPTGGKHHGGHVHRVGFSWPLGNVRYGVNAGWYAADHPNVVDDTMPIRIAEVLDALGVGRAEG